jgi:energy-coupling factor transporter ATP-binding protein EcfA2
VTHADRMTPPVERRGPATIEARGWGWRHAGRRAWALRGVDLRIEAGERVLLLGASGAGKSTLLLGLAGLLDATGGGESEGELLVDGRPAAASRERAGILFQEPESQLVMARAGDDVAFGLENRCIEPSAMWPLVDEALAAVGFAYGRDHPTDALSGGEQQRLALAGTLALRPDLLLLDEPTANLDADGANRLREVLRRIVGDRGLTLVLVEHRVSDSLALVDRVVVVEAGGGVIADGRPDDVFACHGEELEARGVWVPDRRLPAPLARPRPPTDVLIRAEEVAYRYPASPQLALAPTDVTLHAAEAVAVIGRNGTGKSTLALMLGGLIKPTSGAVIATDALAPGHLQDEIWRWPARRLVASIGSVFQDPEHQFLTGRVIDELTIGPMRAGLGSAEARGRADELLARLHLGHLPEANPFTLSGGEKRRLSVATALAAAPSVVILDEPTFGQDRRTVVELLELLAGLRDAGHAICFVTHDHEFASVLADRTLRLAVAVDRAA